MPFLRVLLVFLFSIVSSLPSLALDAPNGSPILTVSGEIAVTNADNRAIFDREMLESLDWRQVETYTPFTEGRQQFAGPTLASLLEALGVDRGRLLATALNDFTIDIPVSDARKHNVLLALDHNGQAMRPRAKGPIWVIYPSDSPDVIDDEHGSRMIWQLNRIQVQK
ncbi:molybdopterin-dependent oxidoreductase [Antarctobacter sp.]|uniref:molybdopterin-dependent oxidoreductase n=1 Tax=Antarctobacter sp. TaxID=1872577 RepID=UPI002B2750B4|nr:molybdopterin-dependent oxidoreductase [Antarctobacter sp.]